MKMNKWTVGLAAAGVVSLASTAQAEENSVLTALSSTVISGSVEVSYQGTLSRDNNLYGAAQDGASGVSASGQGFAANGASLAISSPLGEGDYSAGYRVELLFGERADNFGTAFKNANIGLNLPFGNGVDLTVGLFDTIVGYEVEASASNPNVDRSYGYDLEPFTHTGLLASTSLSDSFSISLGLSNSFDSTGGDHNGRIDGSNGSISAYDDSSFDGFGDGNFAFLAGAEITAPDSFGFLGGSTLFVGIVSGAQENESNDGDDELFYVGASMNTPIENLSLGVAYDDRDYTSDPYDGGGGDDDDEFDVGDPYADDNDVDDAQAVALYALYQISDDVSLSVRYDTIEKDYTDSAEGSDTKSMWSATLGVSIWENVLTRLEYNYETGDREHGDSSAILCNLFYQF